VIIQSFKRAEDNNGFILRLREIEGKETKPIVTLPVIKNTKLKHLTLTDIAENNIKDIPGAPSSFSLTMKPFSIQTLRIF
jgi:alpha-mannosidase